MGRSTEIVGGVCALFLCAACGGTSSSAGPSNAGASSASGGTDSGGAPSMTGTGGLGARAGAPGVMDLGAQQTSDKLDVLFVIDNSLSMSGKQRVLVDSLPSFIAGLTNPQCVDAQGKPTPTQPLDPGAPCAVGARAFTPLRDIHFGVVTTSIGTQGGMVCSPQANPHNDDHGQLLPSVRPGISSYQNSGYLAFDATGNAGVADAMAIASDLRTQILAAGEDGCGYEAPLEVLYRFLVDPEPPLSVTMVAQKSTAMGINDVLLRQRASFLRPDSSLAIVILTDENDCSIVDTNLGWLVGASDIQLPRATSACDANPNDPCCRSCSERETSPPSGCSALAEDSVCKVIALGDLVAKWDALHDSVNLRCFDQRRRFGFELLNPIERYTRALSDRQVISRSGSLVDNPLFVARDGKGPRSPTLVSVSFIVGAPWQDLATMDSLSPGHPLEYLDSAGLLSNDRWRLLVGDSARGVAPGDPFMIESITPRSGKNPLTKTDIVPSTSLNPTASPINGHEQNTPDRSDLQYACTFPLVTPIVCAPGVTCECYADRAGDASETLAINSPACQPPAGGPAGTTQYYGKAYPSTRSLTFARSLGERAVVGSICPKEASNPTSIDYAYQPALAALTRRISTTLK